MAQVQNEQIELLKQMRATHKAMLDDAIEIVDRERPIVASLEAAIRALLGEAAEQTAPTTRLVLHSMSPLFTQPMPERNPEYQGITIMEAVQRALQKIGKEYAHVDEIIREAYAPISDSGQFYRVKRTLVSEILRGIRKGLFKREEAARNSFGLAAQPKREEAKS